MAVGGGWRLAVLGGCRQGLSLTKKNLGFLGIALAARDGGWRRLAVGGPWGLSLTKKTGDLKDSPGSGGAWHNASLCGCLKLVAPIGLLPLTALAAEWVRAGSPDGAPDGLQDGPCPNKHYRTATAIRTLAPPEALRGSFVCIGHPLYRRGARDTGCTPRVKFRRVAVSLRGPGQSPVLPFACCVGSLRSVGRCGRGSCWCRFRVRRAQ